MISYLKFSLFILRSTLAGYTILRSLQFYKMSKIRLSGTVLDIGGTKNFNNPINYCFGDYSLIHANKYYKSNEILKVDLEKKIKLKKKFKFVILLNVLEHIFNFNNAIYISKHCLHTKGKFIGSTPFFYKIHGRPDDFFRYTKSALKKILKKNDFQNITVQELGIGLFTFILANGLNLFHRITIVHFFLVFIVLILDGIFFKYNKNFNIISPLGYFFIATKKS